MQKERQASARDTCYLLRGLVQAATSPAPASRRAAAQYINRTPLRDCNVYGRSVTRPTKR